MPSSAVNGASKRSGNDEDRRSCASGSRCSNELEVPSRTDDELAPGVDPVGHEAVVGQVAVRGVSDDDVADQAGGWAVWPLARACRRTAGPSTTKARWTSTP